MKVSWRLEQRTGGFTSSCRSIDGRKGRLRHQLRDILEFDEYKEVNKEKAVEIEGAEVKRARAGNSFPCWQWRATCHL